MALNFDSMLDATHLLIFLIGASAGAAGTYLADKYTDKRRKIERDSKINRQFAELDAKMSKLFDEMATDLRDDVSKVAREFVVMPSRSTIFNVSKPRFSYFETDHSELRNQVAMQLAAGYLTDVTVGSAPIYSFNEPFVTLLLSR